MLFFLKSTKKSFLIFRFPRDLFITNHLPWLVTEHQLLLHIVNVKNVSVTVRKTVLPTVTATVTFPSLTVISAGILHVTVFTTDMIYICLWIPRVTFRYSLIFPVRPNMTPMAFCMLFFR